MALEEVDPQVVVEVEYIMWKDLHDVDDWRTTLNTLEEYSIFKDWVEVCGAINNVRRLCKFHPAVLQPQLGKVVDFILRALKNPRSALVKTSLMAIGDLFSSLGDQMLQYLKDLLLQLLLKASQDKRFVAEEAEKALLAMSTTLSPTQLLLKLQPYAVHRNPKVRAKATVAVYHAASRMDQKQIQSFGLPALLKLAGGQVSDQLPEAREAARKLTLEIRSAFERISVSEKGENESPDVKEAWEHLCRSELSVSSAHSILRLTAC